MKPPATMILLGLALTACGGTLDPIVGAADRGAQDSGAQDSGPDLAPGLGWQLVASPTSARLQDVWGRSASEVFIVGDGGTILELQDGTWVQVVSGTVADLNALWGLPSGEIYAGGADGTVLQREATGWRSLPSPGGESISDIWAASPSALIAVSSESGTVQRFDGTSWTGQATTSPGLYAIWGSSPTRIFAAGAMDANLILFFHGYDGTSWREMPVTGTSGSVHGIWGDASGAVIAVGRESLYFLEHETSWRTHREADVQTLMAIWGVSYGAVFMVGTGGQRHFWNGAWLETWRTTLTPSALRGVWGTSVTDVWAVGDEGIIQHL